MGYIRLFIEKYSYLSVENKMLLFTSFKKFTYIKMHTYLRTLLKFFAYHFHVSFRCINRKSSVFERNARSQGSKMWFALYAVEVNMKNIPNTGRFACLICGFFSRFFCCCFFFISFTFIKHDFIGSY